MAASFVAVGVVGCAPGAPAPATAPTAAQSPPAERFTLAIHGGAGTIERGSMTPEREAEYRAKLSEALLAGHRILQGGGSSLDAVQAAVNILEDSPLFNAGKGAVFTSEGKNELDAAIMDGHTGQAGAVAGVTTVKNPINLARLVMERSPHVFMIGAGAESFARENGVEIVPQDYFYTESRWNSLQRAKEAEQRKGSATNDLWSEESRKMGTVGAVALDKNGRLAAGTSTGGMTNKKWGRVGDVPVIGAGTYAGHDCAVSATGHGEFFIRSVVAYDICALMQYRGMPLRDAADAVVMEKLVSLGGTGGVIALDKDGTVAMPFNTSGMYRGFVGPDGKVTVDIYRD